MPAIGLQFVHGANLNGLAVTRSHRAGRAALSHALASMSMLPKALKVRQVANKRET
jgi:hypothetical protein